MTRPPSAPRYSCTSSEKSVLPDREGRRRCAGEAEQLPDIHLRPGCDRADRAAPGILHGDDIAMLPVLLHRQGAPRALVEARSEHHDRLGRPSRGPPRVQGPLTPPPTPAGAPRPTHAPPG